MDDVLRVSTEVLVNHRNVIRREKVEGAGTQIPRSYLIINFAKRSSN